MLDSLYEVGLEIEVVMKYPPERREDILRKLLPPNNRPVAEVAQEEGISDATLYNWRNQARDAGQLLPDHRAAPESWSSRDKFNAVLETAMLSEAELGEYCGKRGLYPEQIKRWRQSCEIANERDEKLDKTRLIRFGRFARLQCRQLGGTKPETFDFLGFTHYCTYARRNGWFKVARVR